MQLRLLRYWDMVRTSYWFVPTIMVLATAAVLLITFAIDVAYRQPLQQALSWIAVKDGDGIRQTLATIAGSMITVAGVSFSITIVTLSLASQQLGPRIIRSFMRDRGNQIVLGVFFGTFFGNLLVLEIASGNFIPVVSVLVAWAMGLGSLGVLIYFIHHTAELIQADNVIAAIGSDIDHTIRRLYREHPHVCEMPAEQVDAALPDDFDTHAAFVQALRSGYVQTIDYDAMIELAEAESLILRANVSPGQFTLPHTPVFHVYPSEKCTEAIVGRMRELMAIGSVRTHTQDVEFGINQLVEMAVRALSPGINDPTTACRCIDRLAEAIAHVMRRHMPGSGRRDPKGALRLVTTDTGLTGLVDASFNQIRQAGRGNVAVTIRLLEAIGMLGVGACKRCHRAPLKRQADMIRDGAEQTITEPRDMDDVQRRYDMAIEALEAKGM
ncbi:DUF2254 domain-containing protein [Planctomycetales bacterium ZRK34]|nr:DUF2254 domain-containing protein [Planctomycetales bacterium ZRK34]